MKPWTTNFIIIIISYGMTLNIIYSCNMGMSGLPDVYTRCVALGHQVYILDRPRVHMLQLLCDTLKL